jgi:hypothetical protein
VARHSESLTCFLPWCARQAGAAALLVVLAALFVTSAAAAGGGPQPKRRPVVTGDTTQGSRLVVSHGAWTGAGKLRFSYQWYRCDTMGRHCHGLHGARTHVHESGANDVGHTLSVAVRATDAKGSTTAFASLVGPIAGTHPRLDPLAQPVVAGSAVEGAIVHVRTGRWQPKPSGFAFQWARCNLQLRACASIAGATGATHAIAADDIGHVLVAIVQARSGATARAVFSTASRIAVAKTGTKAKPKPAPTPPAKTGTTGPALGTPPAVAEVMQEGHQLTASPGTWTGSGKIAFTYTWYRCDAAGAHCQTLRRDTGPTYAERARDVGHTLAFAVHATDSTGTKTAYATLLGPVAPAAATLVSTGQPSVAGAPAPAQTLQVSAGSWSAAPTAISYQWERCNVNGRLCAAIAGATAPAYTVTTDDSGHRLLALVHATAGTAAADAISDATAPVAAPPPAGPASTAPPTVAGTAGQGAQLTGAAGTWTGSGTVAYTYNWYRCDAAGAHCLSIHGATKPTYTQGAKDVGHTLGFAVRAADANGTTSAYASLVGPVAASGAPLVATGQPAIAGTAAAGQPLQVNGGSWNAQPGALAYQWERCNANGRLCAPIDGATAAAYTVTTADSGHTLVAVVTASLTTTQQATLSAHTAVVP